jgi:hypothetical protein
MRPLLAGVAIWWSGPRRKSVGFVSGPGLIRYPDKFGPSTSLKVIAYYYQKKKGGCLLSENNKMV